jgi:hypothetical protein
MSASFKDRAKGKKPAGKAESKVEMLFDETVTTAEAKIEGLAEDLVKSGVAKTLGEAQEMVLSDPKNSDLRAQYENKFH